MKNKCVVTKVLLEPEERKKRLLDKLEKDYNYTIAQIREIAEIYKRALGANTQNNGCLPITPREVLELLNRIETLERLDDLESEGYCYASLPLTGNDNKRFMEKGSDLDKRYQQMLKIRREELLKDHEAIKECIRNAGLRIYDPAEAPFNPNLGLTGKPTDVYRVDQLMVTAALFFSMTNLLASTGAGMEEKTAIDLAKMPVIITKKGVYVSRMSTGAERIILVEYGDIEREAPDITTVFNELQKYNPGAGVCERHGNALLGFKKMGLGPVCLKGLVEEEIAPRLKYDFSRYQKK